MRLLTLGVLLLVVAACSDQLVEPRSTAFFSLIVEGDLAHSAEAACHAEYMLPNRNWGYTIAALDRDVEVRFAHLWPGRLDGDVHADRYEVAGRPRFLCTPTNRGGNTSLIDHPAFEVQAGDEEWVLLSRDVHVCRAAEGGSTATEHNDGSIACRHAFGDLFAPVTDFGEPGPYSTATTLVESADCTIFHPAALSASNERHPIILWGNGTGARPTSYAGLLTHLASHGFVVAAANTTNAGTGVQMLGCLDYLEGENDAEMGTFTGKLNVYRVGTSGHSQGGGGSLMSGRDPRIAATAPMQPYVLGLGYQAGTAGRQSGPMFLMSGGADNIASPTLNQGPVFAASNVPTFWGTLVGASHFVPAGSAGAYRGPTTAWFRYHLMLDEKAGDLFHGEECELCTSPSWLVQRKEM